MANSEERAGVKYSQHYSKMQSETTGKRKSSENERNFSPSKKMCPIIDEKLPETIHLPVNISKGNNPVQARTNEEKECETKSLKLGTVAPVKISLSKLKTKDKLLLPKKVATSSAFNKDGESESSDEEMPPEAKMRMRNLGRETPTAAGPNSFGKSRLGFCDRQKITQREIQKKMDQHSENV